MTEETLFHEALARPPAERAAFLEAACAGRPELLTAVQALLAAHERPSNILDQPPENLGQTVDAEPGAGTPAPSVFTAAHYPQVEPGLVIDGRYTLVGKVGEGGMGEVWVAKQTEPVKRKVALKLLKAGMDSKAVLGRFEQERQALALMDHPHIARVFDANLTPTGQPFFAMELVNGLPLTKFCDEARLTPRQRLELFVPICQAVQHAHQKGIIHRDLKPANILVTLIDGRPVPKVIDFGVAKATGGKLTEESLATQFGAVIGTLEYMAPEQAGFSGADVDTRADLYSLGVILYELLTGLRPFDGRRLRLAALTEAVRILKEEEPSKPSTRLSTDEALPSLAALRQTEPKKLMAMLRGELDWVVMKCLEKQRDRRYETANALSRDLQRYLADEPVEARPPSASYRLGKFLRRNRGPVVAACLILAVLLAGLTGTTWGLFEAWRQEGIARQEAAAKEQAWANEAIKAREAEIARDKAGEERGYAEAIAHLLKDDILALTSVEGQERFGGEELTRNATLRELLDLAAEKLRQRNNLAPRTEAEICWIIGVSYRGVGEAARAVPFLKRSLALRRQFYGPEAEETLIAQNSLAVAYSAAGQYDLARSLHEQTLKVWQAQRGPEDPETLASMNNLAATYWEAGKLDLALPLMEQSLKLHKAALGPEHPKTLLSMGHLAAAYKDAGKLALALPLLEETLRLMKIRRGPEHLHTLVLMGNLAGAYQEDGEPDRALPLLEEAFRLQKAKLGPEHPFTLRTMHNLAVTYQEAGRLALALPLHEETLKLSKAKFGPNHPQTLTCMNDLAVAYQAAGKLSLALPLFQETLKLRKDKLGPNHPDTLCTMHDLAVTYQAAGKRALALPLFEKTLQLRKAILGPEHPRTLRTIDELAGVHRAAVQPDLALPLFQEALKVRKANFGPEHRITLRTADNLAVAYLEAGKLALALPLFEETLRLRKGKPGPMHPDTLGTMHNLASAYLAAGKRDLALPLFEETLKLRKAMLGPDDPHTLATMHDLARAYRKIGKLSLALPLFEETLQRMKASPGPEHPLMHLTTNHLAHAYLEAGKRAPALPLLEETVKLRKGRFGPKHPYTLSSMNELGAVYWSVKQFDKAIPLLEEALTHQEATFGRDHFETLKTVLGLGMNYRDAGRLKEAIPLLEEVYRAAKKYPALRGADQLLLDAYARAGENAKLANALLEQLPNARKALPKDSPQLAGILAQIGLGLLAQKKWAEAEPLLRESLASREKSQPDVWTTFNTQSMLGGALLGQQKYAAAEPLLRKGYEGMKKQEAKIPPQGKVRLREAVERLVQLYEATGNQDEAAQWREQLATLQSAAKPMEKQP